MSWIGDKAEATANVLKDLLMQTPAARIARGDLPNVLADLSRTAEEDRRRSLNRIRDAYVGREVNFTPEELESTSAFWNPAGMVGKIVYHGSPHKFDKFDASKIGTGEGAQAYGHGVYLADSEGVAKEYQRTLSGRNDIARFNANHNAKIAKKYAEKWEAMLKDPSIPRPLSASTKQPVTDEYLKRQIEDELAESARHTKWIEESNPGGALYKADLPDEWIPKMLDWDKPIGQQPEVQRALGMRVVKETEPSDSKWLVEFATGKKVGFKTKRDAMTYMTESTGGDVYRAYDPSGAIAARQLQPLGIPGIRYLDGGSRGAGQGSYNYVVFPGLEDQVKILERNGQPVNMIVDALMRSRR